MIAQSGLGLMMLNGWGVTPNPTMALKLFTMAADQGSADGQFHLGQMASLFLIRITFLHFRCIMELLAKRITKSL
jgi:hypothetical protein